MHTLRAVLRDGVEATITTDRRLTHALAMIDYRYDPTTGVTTHDHRLLSWHRSLAEAEAYERMGGETYVVPVTELEN